MTQKRPFSERCAYCGRPRPGYIADPHCPQGEHVYCKWIVDREPEASAEFREQGRTCMCGRPLRNLEGPRCDECAVPRGTKIEPAIKADALLELGWRVLEELVDDYDYAAGLSRDPTKRALAMNAALSLVDERRRGIARACSHPPIEECQSIACHACGVMKVDGIVLDPGKSR